MLKKKSKVYVLEQNIVQREVTVQNTTGNRVRTLLLILLEQVITKLCC